jgi:hypothetical protein
MIGKADFFCNRGEVRPYTLLATLVLVKRDVEAEPPVIFKPGEAAFHPPPGKIPVIFVGQQVIMGIVLDINVIGWGCDTQINTAGSDLFCRENIPLDNAGLPSIKKVTFFHVAPVDTASLFFAKALRLKEKADSGGSPVCLRENFKCALPVLRYLICLFHLCV